MTDRKVLDPVHLFDCVPDRVPVVGDDQWQWERTVEPGVHVVHRCEPVFLLPRADVLRDPQLRLRVLDYRYVPLTLVVVVIELPLFVPTNVQNSSHWTWFIFRLRSMNSLNSFIFSPATLS